jgi:hypothetical protein
MADPHYIDFIRANKDKYPLEAVKKSLVDAGASASEIEEAARQVLNPPAPAAAPAPAAPPAPPPKPKMGAGLKLLIFTVVAVIIAIVVRLLL